MTDSPPVFVFGSNVVGRHGRGAALWAKQHRGAVYGKGEGRQGNSYAIPTKDASLQPLSLPRIAANVERFLDYARAHPEERFQVTPIGCGLAGYTPAQIAPFFRNAPANCEPAPELAQAVVHAVPTHHAMSSSSALMDAQGRQYRLLRVRDVQPGDEVLFDAPPGAGYRVESVDTDALGQVRHRFRNDTGSSSYEPLEFMPWPKRQAWTTA